MVSLSAVKGPICGHSRPQTPTTFSLTVSGPGGTSTRIKQVLVLEPGNEVDALFTYDVSPSDPNTFTFTDASLGPVSSWSWNFGTGSPANADNEGPHTITFPGPGNYSITLEVTGAEGESSTASRIIAVSGNPVEINASFTTDGNKVTDGGRVRFTDTSTGNIRSWFWDFGDGSTSTRRNPTHNFHENGDGQYPDNYIVTLTIHDADGNKDTATTTIEVTEPVPPGYSCNFSYSPHGLVHTITSPEVFPEAGLHT